MAKNITTNPQNSEKSGKLVQNRRKTPCISRGNSRDFSRSRHEASAKLAFSTDFSSFIHHVSHQTPPLALPNFFHFSTVPTTSTSNNLIGKK